jgi:hypothetical protein
MTGASGSRRGGHPAARVRYLARRWAASRCRSPSRTAPTCARSAVASGPGRGPGRRLSDAEGPGHVLVYPPDDLVIVVKIPWLGGY